jgi:hypothetical protein
MRSSSLLLFGLTVATAVNGFPGQLPLAGVVSTQAAHTMEGWSYENCGSWTVVLAIILLTSVHRTANGSHPDRIYFCYT